MRSHSEARGVHAGEVENKQNSLGETGGCSVWQVVHKGGVLSESGFTL